MTEPNFQEILKAKREHYGNTEAAIEFAAEMYQAELAKYYATQMIYAGGTEVKTSSGKIVATITAACIRDRRVTYEISYFNNGDHKTAWLTENEFTANNGVHKTVGYK